LPPLAAFNTDVSTFDCQLVGEADAMVAVANSATKTAASPDQLAHRFRPAGLDPRQDAS
jgi:hypothetical protein